MPDTLLISPDGMLGRAFRELLTQRDIPFETAGRATLDVTAADQVQRALHDGVRCVINCSAYTDVDSAETHEAAALAVNATAVELLGARCKQLGALLVHFSTDYVFNGEGKGKGKGEAEHP